MENPNLLHKLFQCIHPPFWYRSPPPQHQNTPPPHNVDLDGSFEVGFQRLRRWAALKAHQTTPLFVERTPLIVHRVHTRHLWQQVFPHMLLFSLLPRREGGVGMHVHAKLRARVLWRCVIPWVCDWNMSRF